MGGQELNALLQQCNEGSEVKWSNKYIHVHCTKLLKLLCGVPTTSTCHRMEMLVHVLCVCWDKHLGSHVAYLVSKNYLQNSL